MVNQRRPEVLAPEEAKNPRPIAEAPFTLRSIQNRDHILRSSLASDGDDSKAEVALRKEKKWESQIISNSIQSSIVIHGEELAVGSNAKNVFYSSPRDIDPSTGKFAHSKISLLLAIGTESYLAGWDRTASGDWHSILRLNSEQSKDAKALVRSLVNLRNGLVIPKSNWVRLETESFVTELRWKFLILRLKT